MMKLSVLLLVVLLQLVYSRRLFDDIDNEIRLSGSSDPLAFPLHKSSEWVKIHSSPKPMLSKSVGNYVELECEAMGSPPPTIQWLKGKLPLTENFNFETNLIGETISMGIARVRSRIVINYVLPIHEGTYTCTAQSGDKQQSTDTTLFVFKKEGFEGPLNFTQLILANILGAHHLPRVTYFSSTYMDVIGSNVILPCHTIGNPKPTLLWINPDGRIIETDNSDGRISLLSDGSLSIRSLNWADMGIYNCIVRNSMGQDSIETFLYPMKE